MAVYVKKKSLKIFKCIVLVFYISCSTFYDPPTTKWLKDTALSPLGGKSIIYKILIDKFINTS